LEKVEITLVGVKAVVQPPGQVVLDLTCEIANANSSWVDVERVEYCVMVGSFSVRCGVYPSDDTPQRVRANGVIETRIRVVPKPDDVPKLIAILLESGGRQPEAYLTGTAVVKSPIGRLSSDFKTGPIQVAIRKIGLSFMPDGLFMY